MLESDLEQPTELIESNLSPESLDLLDHYLGKLVKISKDENRILVLVSSMGQKANDSLQAGIQKLRPHDFRLKDVRKLVDKITVDKFKYRVDAGMVPEYSLHFLHPVDAERCFIEVQESKKTLENIWLEADLNTKVITLSTSLEPNAESYSVRGRSLTYSELGFEKFRVEDHHSGHHCPEGSLIIFNSNTSSAKSKTINYLEYAPGILKHFGIDKPDYMLEPSFSL